MTETAEAIRQLLQEEQFAALSTTKSNQPYVNLVAFAEVRDLTAIVFCTPQQTRKYQNLQHNPQVALLVENSRNQAADLTQAMALTIIGDAVLTKAVDEVTLADNFLQKHPHMKEFLFEASTALVRVRVEKYVLVKNFQDTQQYIVKQQ